MVYRDDTGHTFFQCQDPDCLFSGDTVTLTATVRKLSLTDTVNLFRPGEELAYTLTRPISNSVLDGLLHEKESQLHIATYLARSQQALRRESTSYRLRGRLSGNNTEQLPPELGALLPDDLPSKLRELEHARYSREGYYIYPYSYGGRTMLIRTQPVAGAYRTLPIVRPDLGVFPESLLTEETDTVFVATTAFAACRLYMQLARQTAILPAIVNIAGYPLGHRYIGIRNLILLSLLEYPLSFAEALEHFAAAHHVEGRAPEDQPEMAVYTIAHPLTNIHTGQLDGCGHQSNQWAGRYQPLATWLRTQMELLIQQGEETEICDALLHTSMPDARQQALVEAVQGSTAAKQLLPLLQSTSIKREGQVLLANGRTLRCTSAGFRGLKADYTEQPLSNTTFTVESRIKARDKSLIYVCRFQCPRTQPVIARLPSAAFRSADRLTDAANLAFADIDNAPYVTFYDRVGYKWSDILLRLSEGCPSTTEICELGVSDSLEIHMPNCIIDSRKGSIHDQDRIFTIPDNALNAYGGITYDPDAAPETTFTKLLRRTDNMYIAGLAAGILHVLHQVQAALSCARRNQPFIPQHLFYVETEQSIWRPIFTQLVQLFSGNGALPLLPVAFRSTKLIANLSAFGCLPYPVLLANVRPDKLRRLTAESPAGLISILDGNLAMSVAECMRSSFVVPTPGKPEQVAQLADPDLDALRRDTAGMMLKLGASADSELNLYTSTIPAQAAYHLLCQHLDIAPPNSLVGRLTKQYYGGDSYNNAKAFFHVLYDVIYGTLAAQLHIHPERGLPSAADLKSTAPPPVYVTEDYALCSKALVALANKHSRLGMFHVNDLDAELQEEQYLYPEPPSIVDTRRYWCIKIDYWNKYVKKQPIRLATVTQGNIIRLSLAKAG